MREDQIQREYEIDFESRAGQKVFWYLAQNPTRWRIPNLTPKDIPKNWRVIASLDYGSLNPTAIHIYAIDEQRRFYSMYEFYKPAEKGESMTPEILEFFNGTHKQFPVPREILKRLEKVVADPAIFRKTQDGGEEMRSIADILEDGGLNLLEPGENDRQAGLERLQNMLRYLPNDEAAEPYLFFCQRCENQWKELTELVYEELPPHLLLNKNKKEDVVAKNDHCFAAGTMISTPNGDRPIEEIVPGDLVLTRLGARPVISCGQAGVRPTYTLIFSNGSKVRCTDNHPFFTENRGLVRADELSYADICVTELRKKKLFSMESLSEGIQSLQGRSLESISFVARTFSEAASALFTARFGSFTMGRFQLATTSTTGMGTHSITTSPIWSVSRPLRISASTENSFQKKRWQPGTEIDFFQKNGTNQRLASDGTACRPRKRGLTQGWIARSAKSAAALLRSFPLRQSLPGSARQNADQASEGRAARTTFGLIASFVVSSLRRTGTQRRKPVAVSAAALSFRLAARVEPVFNLTVEDQHEYFANGMLVANSYDALRYALLSITAPSGKPEKKKAPAGSLEAMEKDMFGGEKQGLL